MPRSKFIFAFSALACLFITTGCSSMPASYSRVSVSLPQGTRISAEDIENAVLEKLSIGPESGKIIELTVYDYSTGKERLIYTETGTINQKDENGYIKVLCSIKENGRLNKVFFIEASGLNDAEIIISLKEELAKRL